MPVFFQHRISDDTRLGIWKIEETEEFFKGNVPLHRDVTHPHKRLQHLAGRFLLQYLFPDFPFELIQIADTRKPFLPDEQFHFSISHCGDFAAAIVSREKRVGIDIEIPGPRVQRIIDKFLSNEEKLRFDVHSQINGAKKATLLWSSKESIFKWYGDGAVDFREQIHLKNIRNEMISCFFVKTNRELEINYREFEGLTLAWVQSD